MLDLAFYLYCAVLLGGAIWLHLRDDAGARAQGLSSYGLSEGTRNIVIASLAVLFVVLIFRMHQASVVDCIHLFPDGSDEQLNCLDPNNDHHR